MEIEVQKDLKSCIDDDLTQRQQWYKRCDELRSKRLGKRPAHKKYPYQGAPNFVVQLIDDLTRSKTSQEISMLLNAKNISFFTALSPATVNMTEELSTAFNHYMRHKIKARSKLECILDQKNEIGIGIAKEIDSYDIEPGVAIPDFMPVDPFDVIVPIETTFEKEPERICHILRLTQRELLERGKNKGWKNTQKIIEKFATKDDSDGATDSNRTDFAGYNSSPAEKKYYVIWEVYHWRKNENTENPLFDYSEEDVGVYKGSKRWLTIMSPDFPEIEILNAEWEDDHFPFVQFRYENRTMKWYDSRGIAQILIDEQLYSTIVKNMKATSLEYFGKPLFEGNTENSQNISFEPGSRLPIGVKPVQMPNIPAQFDYDLNASYSIAEKKIGVFEQSLSSNQPQSGNKPKTATEVVEASGFSRQITTDAVERFNEPLAILFQRIWKKLCTRKIAINYLSESGMPVNAQLTTQQLAVLIVPAGNQNTANPMMTMQVLSQMLPTLIQSPYIKQDELLSYIISTIDAKVAKKIVVTGGQPQLQQQMQQLMQGQQQLGQIVQEIGQALQKLQPDLQAMKAENEEQSKESEFIRKTVLELQKSIANIAKKVITQGEQNEQMDGENQIFSPLIK